MFNNDLDQPRPKALRVPITQLSNIDCVASFSTRNAILRKDATHNPPQTKPNTLDDTTLILGDKIKSQSHILIKVLDKNLKTYMIDLLPTKDENIKQAFLETSPIFIELCNSTYELISKLILDLKLNNEDDLHSSDAIKSLATTFTTNISI